MNTTLLSGLDVILAAITVLYLGKLLLDSRSTRLRYLSGGLSRTFLDGINLVSGPYTKRSLLNQHIVRRIA